MTPNDAIEPTGLLLANSRGESVSVSWEQKTPPHDPPQPSHTGIQRINTRFAKTRDTVIKVHLEGMTDAGVEELAALARSWEHPARLSIETAGFTGGEYDPSERAWILDRASAGTSALTFTVAASPDAPVENLALIIRGWGERGATLTVDGRPLDRGTDLRISHRPRLEATDLVVFATIRSTSPMRLVLAE